MRSVNVERKGRSNARVKAVRPAARGKRDMPKVQPGSARRAENPGLDRWRDRHRGRAETSPLEKPASGCTLDQQNISTGRCVRAAKRGNPV